MLRCNECDVLSDEQAWGWRGVLAQDPDEDAFEFVVILCPRCCAREFGWDPLLTKSEPQSETY